ncbi:hypothetical protein CONPUDRAFT_33810, partial [Coniophora puteana RWD-64-598 SS2]
FITICSKLKDDIVSVYPHLVDTESSVPPALPYIHSIYLFLATSIPLSFIPTIWDATKDTIWELSGDLQEHQRTINDLYKLYGWERGITRIQLHPHIRSCIQQGCKREGELQQQSTEEVIVFTLTSSIQRAKATSLYCPSCKVTYTDNYYIHQGAQLRTYYDHMPQYIKMNEHHFVETRIAEKWTSSMV